MKAVQISRYGGTEVLEVIDVLKPSLKTNQVLVEIKAAGINPVDWKLRSGMLKDWMPLQFPATLGGDFSGVVVEAGPPDTQDELAKSLRAGDEVFGSASVLGGGSGSFAQFAGANVGNISLKPKSLNFQEAAALPLVSSSAVQALEEHIKLQSGQKILIHGGAGGIGHVAIQIAKHIGAYVITTVGTDDVAFVKELGVDEVIDYKTQKFEDLVKDIDAVFDMVGGETLEKSFLVLKKGGVLVTMVGQPNQEKAKEYSVTAIGQGTDTNATHLQRVSELVENGSVKVNVDKTYPLNQIKEAFEYQENDHPRGKVILTIT